MMGERRVMQEALFYGFSLERHVPDNHMLRKIDRFVDLSDLRARQGPLLQRCGTAQGQRRVPIGRHRPKSAETRETHPPSGADFRHMRRRGSALTSPKAALDANRRRAEREFFNEADVRRPRAYVTVLSR